MTTATEGREFFNVPQAAEYVGVAATTVQEAAACGELTGSKVGRRWVFTRTDLTRWVASKRIDMRVTRLRSTA